MRRLSGAKKNDESKAFSKSNLGGLGNPVIGMGVLANKFELASKKKIKYYTIDIIDIIIRYKYYT